MIRPVVLALSLLAAAPVVAEGSFGFTYTPRTQSEADAWRLGLALYALSRDGRSQVDLRQSGSGNRGGVRQSGSGQIGVIRQDGTGHSADLTQSGRANAQVTIQRGRGTDARVVQQGTGQAGLLFLYGW